MVPVFADGGIGGGSGQPSAISVAPLPGGIGGGSGQPSAISVAPLPGGIGGGSGQPSATTGLLRSYLPFLLLGSRIKAARSKTMERIASFFMDEPSWLVTMRARVSDAMSGLENVLI